METKELVQQAIDKKYSDFDRSTKDILAQKVAAKLDEKGYFDRLNQAKGLTEAENVNPFAKKDSKDKDEKDKDEKDSKDSKEDEKDSKDKKKENPFTKKD